MNFLNKKRLFAIVGGVALAALSAVTVVLWQRPTAAATTAAAGSAEPPTVQTVRPERTVMRRIVTLPGQIESYAQVPIFAKITGYVDKFHADLGDRVAKDQVLVELSVPEMVEDLELKKAGEELAAAQVEMAERALETAEKTTIRSEAALKQTEAGLARVEASVLRWRAENERMKQLLPTRSVDQSTADVTTEQLKTAETALVEMRASIAVAGAARDESVARRNQAETDVKVAKVKLRVAASDRRRTAELLNYSKIVAPFPGVITRRNVDHGHLLQPPSGSAPSSTPLYILDRIDKVRVFLEVPEMNAATVALGAVVKIRVPALRDQEWVGSVVRSSVALHPQGRTMRAQVDLPNEDGRLSPGQYVSARIESEEPGVFTAPASAVFVQNDQPMVVRVENGKAVWTPVRIGIRQGGKVELIKKQVQVARSGEAIDWKDFTGEEEIVAERPTTWVDGQAVRSSRDQENQTKKPGV